MTVHFVCVQGPRQQSAHVIRLKGTVPCCIRPKESTRNVHLRPRHNDSIVSHLKAPRACTFLSKVKICMHPIRKQHPRGAARHRATKFWNGDSNAAALAASAPKPSQGTGCRLYSHAVSVIVRPAQNDAATAIHPVKQVSSDYATVDMRLARVQNLGALWRM